MLCRIEVIGNRDKAHPIQREHPLNEVAGLDGVATETAEIFDKNAADPPVLYQLQKLLHGGAFEVQAGKTVVHKLPHRAVQIGVGDVLI